MDRRTPAASGRRASGGGWDGSATGFRAVAISSQRLHAGIAAARSRSAWSPVPSQLPGRRAAGHSGREEPGGARWATMP